MTIYGALVFLLVFIIGYLVFVKNIWQDPLIIENWRILLIPPQTLFATAYIPAIFGGSLTYGIKKLKRKFKKENKN